MTSIISQITTQGYTDHEMDDELGLINMNARLYDPKLGRFLQADSIVPNPTSTQSFNRYSYVSNNPMSFVDPDGYAPEEPPEPPETTEPDDRGDREDRDDIMEIEIRVEIDDMRDFDNYSDDRDRVDDLRERVYDIEERLDELREDAAEFREYLYGNAPPVKNSEPQSIESIDYSEKGRDIASKLLKGIKATNQWFKETMGITGNTKVK